MPNTLDQEYQRTIDAQRQHLLELQSAFNGKCETSKTKAEEKLKTIPEDKKEEKEAVLQEEKAELEEALKWLKNEIAESTRVTMKKLEDIQRQREAQILLDLEKQMNTL